MAEAAQTPTLEDAALEGERLARAAKTAGVTSRLIGGVAVWILCPSARKQPLARSYGDADFVGRGSERKQITAFFESEGYVADRLFNAIHGATRLNFHDPARDRPVDVLLDRFVMAHELDLRDSASPDGLTVALPDLLLSKLQVVSINEKDLRDLLALLVDHDPAAPDVARRVADVTESDWGFEHTIHRTLATIRERIGEFDLPAGRRELVEGRTEALDALLDAAPKGLKWKARARIGERAKWYAEPEEAR